MEGTFTVEYMVSNGAVLRCTTCHETYTHTLVDGEEPFPVCPNEGCHDIPGDEPVDDFTDHHYFNPIEQGFFDDDPSPYDGTYSEE
jgi:hypothetical protein